MASISLVDALAPPLPIHRFTVEQYHRLGDMGVLTSEDRVELLEGWIVKKMNQRPIHGFMVGWLNEWFQQCLPPGWIVRCQLPITTDRSEPEPDLAILKGKHSDFRHTHPFGIHCSLVIEVADTSLDKDRAKASIYMAAGVQEYWIINVAEKVLERYEFSSDAYSKQSAKSPVAESQVVHAFETIALNLGESSLALELRKVFNSAD